MLSDTWKHDVQINGLVAIFGTGTHACQLVHRASGQQQPPCTIICNLLHTYTNDTQALWYSAHLHDMQHKATHLHQDFCVAVNMPVFAAGRGREHQICSGAENPGSGIEI